MFPSVALGWLLVPFFLKEISCLASLCSLSGDGGSLDRHPPIQPKGSLPINAHRLHSGHSDEEIKVKHFIQMIPSNPNIYLWIAAYHLAVRRGFWELGFLRFISLLTTRIISESLFASLFLL